MNIGDVACSYRKCGMWRNELVSFGDVMDFLEWRRIYRGIPYGFQSIASKPKIGGLPVLRFYYSMKRLYVVTQKDELRRVKLATITKGTSKTSRCTFTPPESGKFHCGFFYESSSYITVVTDPFWSQSHEFSLLVNTPEISSCIVIQEEVVCSLFKNGYVENFPCVRDGSRVILS